ncbi:efflux RND transporter periplasmic adaptor subunit [Sphingobium limneticum]|jgi:cobalt-zinc-cadmium efflux system membrane fusion protein|uniref:efflux RND transporter periplasmic adaptor subunit n=1 Tax=Sphingobium limneticum TaxID=1007511 RepID=UPI003D01693B
MTSDNKLYAGAAVGLILAALAGFGAARMTAPTAPVEASAEEASAPVGDEIEIDADGIRSSAIMVAPASGNSLDGILLASATVEAMPDAEAVLTARAPGTVTRIFKRIGDVVSAGETIALVESRDASMIAADRGAAAARTTLAARQLAREKGLLAQGVSARADYETAQANLAVAQAEARQAEAAARAVRVTGDGRSVAVVSAVSGRITAAPASLGAYVQAETELFRVADPRRTQIEASVPAGEAGRVKAGDRVELTTNDGQVLEGRVRSATGVVDAMTRQATIVITPGSGGSTIAPGQMVQARIFASGDGQSASGVSVPQDAVQTVGDRTVVFVRMPKGFKAQTIQVAGRSGGMVAVASGLKAGQSIATTNAFLLKAELEKESAE